MEIVEIVICPQHLARGTEASVERHRKSRPKQNDIYVDAYILAFSVIPEMEADDFGPLMSAGEDEGNVWNIQKSMAPIR